MSIKTESRVDGSASERTRNTVGRRVALGLATVLPGLLTAGAVASLVSGPDEGIHRVHDLVHVAWIGLLVTVPYAMQWRRPRATVALWQAAAVTAVVLPIGGGIARVADPVFYVAFPLFAFLTWLTHPARPTLRSTGAGLSPVLGPLAAIGAVAATLFAADQLGLQRDFASDPHGEMTHYAATGIAALTMAVFAAVAAFRTAGWQWAAGLAATAALAWGAMSLVQPDASGSLGTTRGVQLVVGASLFAAAAVWEGRRG